MFVSGGRSLGSTPTPPGSTCLKAPRHRLLPPTASKCVDKLNAGEKSHTQNLSSNVLIVQGAKGCFRRRAPRDIRREPLCSAQLRCRECAGRAHSMRSDPSMEVASGPVTDARASAPLC